LVLYAEHEDTVLAFISSKLTFKHTHDITIKKSDVNNLETDSVIILRKLFTGNKSLIKGKIGEVDKVYYTSINNSINYLLKL
jgi:hypothetical protein